MKASSIATGVAMVAAIAAAAYVMAFHLGLSPELDFGCGQYYYTDIPDWQRRFSVDGFEDGLPMWLYFVLFFAWGFLMYRLWVWIDAGADAGDEVSKEG